MKLDHYFIFFVLLSSFFTLYVVIKLQNVNCIFFHKIFNNYIYIDVFLYYIDIFIRLFYNYIEV